MSSSYSLTLHNCTWGSSRYTQNAAKKKCKDRHLALCMENEKILNRSFSAKLCLLPRILGAVAFFVLPKEKGNISGS
jgi:hypothetical protein